MDPARQRYEDQIERLNPEQHRAVLAGDGAILVNAGAGTGKTRVLTVRIAHLIHSNRVRPDEILAVTFTNKAAREMRERVEDLVGAVADRIVMGNFHSISMRMLRDHAEECGLRNERFQVADEDDQKIICEKAMERVGIADPKATETRNGVKHSADWKADLKFYHRQIQSWKSQGLTPEDVAAAVAAGQRKNPNDAMAVYRAYQLELLERNLCDFADLILHVVALFRRRPEMARERYGARFKAVLVDELQDTDELQYEWLNWLAGVHGNITGVGDLDQCIYEWRSAKPDLFRNFPKAWNAEVITLDRNYRSTQPILDAANAVVADIERVAPKVLRSDMGGEPVRCLVFAGHFDEADWIADDIKAAMDKNTPASEMAVLVRTSRSMNSIEQAMRRRDLAYEVIGGQRFYDRSEIKDMLAYLRLATLPEDELAFRRICNRPVRSVGDVAANTIISRARTRQIDFIAATRDAANDPGVKFAKKTREGAARLAELLDGLKQRLDGGMQPGGAIGWLIEESGYVDWLKEQDPDGFGDRADNLEELKEDANQYEDTASFLQLASVMSAADTRGGDDAVSIMTMHAAKGLEFSRVYTPCLERGILPIQSALTDERKLHEEARICHVAWTRARDHLTVSWASQRYAQAQEPSPFLEQGGLEASPARGGPSPRFSRSRRNREQVQSHGRIRAKSGLGPPR